MKPQEAESHVEIGKEMKTFSASRYVWRKLLAAKKEYSWQFRGSIWKSFKRRFSLWNLEKAPLKGWEPLSIRQSTGDFNKSLGPSALEFQQGASELSQGEEKKSDDVQYNTLGGWVDGTNDSSTKCLMFQAQFYIHCLLFIGML